MEDLSPGALPCQVGVSDSAIFIRKCLARLVSKSHRRSAGSTELGVVVPDRIGATGKIPVVCQSTLLAQA